MNRFRTTAILAALLPLTFAFKKPEGDQVTLKWTGCGITKKAFMEEAARAYQAKTGVAIELSGGGATKGIRFVNSGMTDLGGCCRPAFSDEFPKEEGKVFLTVVAWDALVPIVHPDQVVETLTTEQLKGILTGKISNWKEVGGADRPMHVIVRTGNLSGVGAMTRLILFDDPGLAYREDAEVVKSSGPAEEAVEQDVDAITITGVSSALHRKVKLLALNGAYATAENIAAGEYATFRPLYISYTLSEQMAESKAFLDWLISEEGQAVVERCGTVSLRQGAELTRKFQHWTDVKRITNFPDLEARAEEAARAARAAGH